jgi:hypothetical protein
MVVDTIGFDDRGWIDTEKGRPQTEALHVTERFRRLEVGHMQIGVTIDDPKAYAHPWSATIRVPFTGHRTDRERMRESARRGTHVGR